MLTIHKPGRKENPFQVFLWETFNITASVYIRGNREGWTCILLCSCTEGIILTLNQTVGIPGSQLGTICILKNWDHSWFLFRHNSIEFGKWISVATLVYFTSSYLWKQIVANCKTQKKPLEYIIVLTLLILEATSLVGMFWNIQISITMKFDMYE